MRIESSSSTTSTDGRAGPVSTPACRSTSRLRIERTTEDMSAVFAVTVNQRRLARLPDDPRAKPVAFRASMKRYVLMKRRDMLAFHASDGRARVRCADHARATAAAPLARVTSLRRLAHFDRYRSQDRFRSRQREKPRESAGVRCFYRFAAVGSVPFWTNRLTKVAVVTHRPRSFAAT